jgi:hypothetical protein
LKKVERDSCLSPFDNSSHEMDAVLSSPTNSPGDDLGDDFYNRTKTKKLKVLINTGLSASFQQGMRESNP